MIIDLSVFKKEDIEVMSLTGEKYTIPGNFSTEFFINLYDTYQKVEKLKKEDCKRALQILKDIALQIIKLDTSKKVSIDTINEQFNDFKVLEMLLSSVIQEISKDPNFNSPTLG